MCHMHVAINVHSRTPEASFTFCVATSSVETIFGMPSAFAIATWFSRFLCASCEIALAQFSLAVLEVLLKRCSSRGMPFAFRILVRFSSDGEETRAVKPRVAPLRQV